MPTTKVLYNYNCFFLLLKIINKSNCNYKYSNYPKTSICLILINIYILYIKIYILAPLIIYTNYIKIETITFCLLPLRYAYIKAYIKASFNILKLRIK